MPSSIMAGRSLASWVEHRRGQPTGPPGRPACARQAAARARQHPAQRAKTANPVKSWARCRSRTLTAAYPLASWP